MIMMVNMIIITMMMNNMMVINTLKQGAVVGSAKKVAGARRWAEQGGQQCVSVPKMLNNTDTDTFFW